MQPGEVPHYADDKANTQIDSVRRCASIVDASNVARTGSSAKLQRIQSILSEFSKINLESIPIADASLRHYIDDKHAYEILISQGRIVQTPAGSSADAFIIQTAQQLKELGIIPLVVTNDLGLVRAIPSSVNLRFSFIPIATREYAFFDPPLRGLKLGSRGLQ